MAAKSTKPGMGKVPTEPKKANPADFGKKSSPVRERMAREIKETPPDERIKGGR